MAAAVVELDALADAVRTTAQDDDLVARGRIGLVDRPAVLLVCLRQNEPAFVSRIHVGGRRGELGGAGVDALEHRPDVEGDAALAHLRLAELRQLGQSRIREAHRLEQPQMLSRCRQAMGFDARFHVDDLLDAR